MIKSLHKFLKQSDMMAYLVMMANRLLELHRVLKPTGSLYLHCDPTASHYIKIVLNSVFGVENYQNEIIWKRTYAHSSSQKWGDVHDVIFLYAKSNQFTWNRQDQPYEELYLESKYRYEDQRGRYRLVVLTAPGTTKGKSGKIWKDYDPAKIGRHWSVPQKPIREILGKEPLELHVNTRAT